MGRIEKATTKLEPRGSQKSLHSPEVRSLFPFLMIFLFVAARQKSNFDKCKGKATVHAQDWSSSETKGPGY
jgi:hypothetical protein